MNSRELNKQETNVANKPEISIDASSFGSTNMEVR